MRWIPLLFCLIFTAGMFAPAWGAEGAFVPAASAQDPVQEVQNLTGNTSTEPQYDLISILAAPERTYADLNEREVARIPISVMDRSREGSNAYSGAILVLCDAAPVVDENVTVRGWAVSDPSPVMLSRGQTAETEVMINAGLLTAPDIYRARVTCTAGAPIYRVVGEFDLVARVLPYYKLSVSSVGVPEKMAPFESFAHDVAITNNGNQLSSFRVSVTAPDGWTVSYPSNVMIEPGDTSFVTISGNAPRDKLIYTSGSGTMIVTVAPADAPGRSQSALVPLQVQGVYMHPALVPLIVLAVIIVASIIFLGVLTRRAIEEQILGKPVPPWRIPVEREALQQLQKEDPDQFYIVRYYLMVEEHESALLWFAAFKKATKKDRKHETKWYKKKKKQDRKIAAVEKDHAKVEKKWDRQFARVDKKRDRKIRKLEKKLRRKERKERRLVGRKHKKRVKKIEKKHAKKVKKATKKHEKLLAKETKKVERQNKKREKKGEELLPLPEIPAPDLGEPELPEQKEIEETPLEESRYAKRADRRRERAEKKKERLRLRQEKQVAKSRLHADAKIEKLQAKIPPEPTTHLYDADEYIPDDQVIVEDDRPFVAKLLHVPTLEERERMRRRRSVYQARLKEAKASGDPAKVAEVKERYNEEMEALKQERRDDLAVHRAGDAEAARLRKEKKRAAKERAKKKAAEPAAEGPATPSDVPEEKKIRPGLPVRLPGRKRETTPEEGAPQEAPPAEAPATEDTPSKGFKARFQRRKAERSADSEEAKKEPTESSEEAAAASGRQE